MELIPLTGRIGAEIRGVDPTAPDAEALRAALARHAVLVIRGAGLDLERQRRLTAAFGAPMTLPYVPPMPDAPDAIRVVKEADDPGGVFGGDWHSDFSFLERPPAGSVLCAVEPPPWGGDTVWTSMAAAWEALPAPLQALLAGRDAIHVGKPYGVKWAPPEEGRASMRMARGDPSADAERRHPAVLRCPRTGRRALYLNPTYVTRLDGLTEEESRLILAQIQAHCVRPDFQYRHRWGPGDAVVWDNLATQHYAVNDYQGFRREMRRTTFAGPAPRDLAA